MAFNLVRSETFELDVFDTLDYLSKGLSSPNAARALMGDIDHAVDILAEQPFIHALSDKPGLVDLACRECFVKRYSIIYRVEGDTVFLLRLLHQSQDPARLVVDWGAN